MLDVISSCPRISIATSSRGPLAGNILIPRQHFSDSIFEHIQNSRLQSVICRYPYVASNTSSASCPTYLFHVGVLPVLGNATDTVGYSWSRINGFPYSFFEGRCSFRESVPALLVCRSCISQCLSRLVLDQGIFLVVYNLLRWYWSIFVNPSCCHS